MAGRNNFTRDQYNKNYNKKSTFSFYNSALNASTNAFIRAFSSSIQFGTELYNAFAEFYLVYLDTIYEYNRSWKDLAELDKLVTSRSYRYSTEFREEIRELAFRYYC